MTTESLKYTFLVRKRHETMFAILTVFELVGNTNKSTTKGGSWVNFRL